MNARDERETRGHLLPSIVVTLACSERSKGAELGVASARSARWPKESHGGMPQSTAG